MLFKTLHKYSIAILMAYSIVALGSLGTCLLIKREMNHVVEASESLYTHPFAVSNAALEAKDSVAGIRESIIYAVLSRDPALARAALESEASGDARFEQDIAVIETNYLGDLKEVAVARQQYAIWKTMRREILAVADRGDFDLARAMVMSSGSPAYGDLRTTLDGIIKFARDKAMSLNAEARRKNDRTNRIVLATILLGFTTSFASGMLVLRHVQRLVRSNEEFLTYQANHDQLTGLPNRGLFLDRLGHALNVARREKSLVAVMFIDLDGFKAINDTLGHDAGDELLLYVSNRLTSSLRRSDTVARFGGDEFVAMITDAHNHDEIFMIADKIAGRVNSQTTVKDTTIFVSCSFGVAVFPRDGADIPGLMARADAVMYQSKQEKQKPEPSVGGLRGGVTKA
jgi:diguanylate cyclase (GGDEF)-like protein